MLTILDNGNNIMPLLSYYVSLLGLLVFLVLFFLWMRRDNNQIGKDKRAA
jgi:lipid-A-disaccharide synthase-like uncharacterized protein